MIIYMIYTQDTNIRKLTFGTVMSSWPRHGGMAGDVFWLKEEYGAYILSLPMKENGCQIFLCINGSGSYIHNFYIFKGRSFRRNFIIRCEEGACMTMQKKT